MSSLSRTGESFPSKVFTVMALCEKGTSKDGGKRLGLITDSFVSAVS